jgi:transcriptional regulator with PAS, ATPase and Fis domain
MHKRLLCVGHDRSRFATLIESMETSQLDCIYVDLATPIELQSHDIVALDLQGSKGHSQVLEAVRETDGARLVVHDYGAMAGAFDSPEWVEMRSRITFTTELQSFAEAIRRAVESPGSEAAEPWRKFLIGEHPSLQNIFEIIRLVSQRQVSVLITGETGTGKELVARAIHMASGRSHLPMVSVNCAALPETLLEAELFGHTKGAFTGANNHRIGRFEQAHRGTIFLDEIGDLPIEVQAKFLRALQEREIQRVGSSESVQLDIRVIAATNADLMTAVQQKKFRQDLFYRLNVLPVHVPALRDRKSDIPLLVDYFLEKLCKQERLPVKSVVPEVVEHLSNYSWPGNIRELEHQVEKAIALSGNRRKLYPIDFALSASGAPAEEMGLDLQMEDSGLDFGNLMIRIERNLLDQALKKANGNKAKAADMLGMKRTTLLSKVKALGCYAQ